MSGIDFENINMTSNNSSSCHSAAEKVIKLLGSNLDFSDKETSYSPFYSDIGLGFGQDGGIENLFLHYNRSTSKIGPDFARLHDGFVKSDNTVTGIKQYFSKGSTEYVFYDRNSWLIGSEGGNELSISLTSKNDEINDSYSKFYKDSNIYIVNQYMPNTDKRDPDPRFPLIIGVRIIKGEFDRNDNRVEFCSTSRTGPAASILKIKPDAEGKILVAFSVNMLDISENKIIDILLSSPASTEEAKMRTFHWFKTALGSLDAFDGEEKEAEILAKAALTLVFNCCRAPGLLGGRVSCFPSRGKYPTHFLWDSCFQNLALEYMEPKLAEDSLLLLTDNLRADGKMGHFICSTWVRPLATQPPLVGWSGLRLIEKRNDKELAEKLLKPLCKNTEWWLTQRMTRFGIVYSLDPYETGWDDTPRFDDGFILPCDMNSYLLMQMRACVKLADMIGDSGRAAVIKKQAEAFAKKIMAILYDAEENIFKDVLVETGEKITVKTPACFMPLLAEVPLEKDKAEGMIKDHLLDPDKFFGNILFPSVAYDEEKYMPAKCWRGPTWLPIAYLMLEILNKFGFKEEYELASKKLYRMIIDDGKISEWFNSQTGEGLGSKQQGWTAAILLKLKMENISKGNMTFNIKK